MQIPNLTAFRYFDTAAQAGSFVQAAQLLHVTHGAVSRQIRALEESLGVELFERRNRAVFLTPAGRQLLHVTAPMFERLEDVVYQLQQTQREHALAVSCEPTIAMKWLIPRLGNFQALHPNITVHLITAGGPVNFAQMGVDLAIRRDDFHWADSVCGLRLCDEKIGPVCQPQYPYTQEASKQVLIHSSSRAQAWATWARLSNTTLRSASKLQLEHFYLCIQAALSGQGMAMVSQLMVEDELHNGQLIAPHGFIPDGSAYYLLSPQALDQNPRAEVFADWLCEQLAS
ncbi:LysR substrate-binding domain-containing protein [Alcaligenes parafaecalis]|uniref:LysR substrate-binding domain-containing protein n=1 Tax=Alcaligenes parafaecalis TaxID=171260 RepID=A0ABT3VLR3_9BURK|nr:LysR substrate-binding domain-containing protein [Alcaligenes parafaecalis]MCX5464451.1 LysR substrate-binding domain-containing protein [Alcaligenes parafaecalis]